jgi:hypothetical protein
MKALGIMLLLVGSLATPVIAQGTVDVSTAPSASSSTLFLIVPGQSIGPVRLGTDLRGEMVRLGPAKGTAKLDDGTTVYRWFVPPSNIGIGVRTNQNGIVLRVWVLNDARYSTKEGLHVGSTEAAIRAALGAPTRVEVSSRAKTKTLIYEARGLWLNIQLDQQLNFYNTVFDIGIMTTQGSPLPAASAPQTLPSPAGSASQGSPPPQASAPQKALPPAAPAPQVTPPPLDPSRLYMVRATVSDRDRAAAIEKQLVAGGFSQTKVTTQPGFRVVSEPLPRSAAEGLIATLAGRGFPSQLEPLGGETVQLVFGSFSAQREAETLSQRIAAAGYDAWVREGAVYTLQLGPYPQASVNTITGIIKSGAPDAAVTADPVTPQTAPPPAASAPQASPAPPPPPAPLSASGNRQYSVRVVLSDRDRALALANQLLAGGFSQAKVSMQPGFRVMSEPLPRSVAEGLIATLAKRGFQSHLEPLAGDAVQLVFGTFTTQKEADALAQRIGAAGYDAWVHEGTVYTLEFGLFPQSSVNTITGIVKSGAPDATVTVVPAP